MIVIKIWLHRASSWTPIQLPPRHTAMNHLVTPGTPADTNAGHQRTFPLSKPLSRYPVAWQYRTMKTAYTQARNSRRFVSLPLWLVFPVPHADRPQSFTFRILCWKHDRTVKSWYGNIEDVNHWSHYTLLQGIVYPFHQNHFPLVSGD